MTATTLTTARPPRAAIAWVHGEAIYVEIPHKDGGAPFIVRYHKTTTGLADALNILIEHADAPTPIRDPNANHPAIRRSKTTVAATESQREAAREMLKKMGLV